MVIYIDLVILLNFIIDMLLLVSVSLLLKRNVSWKKIILGSLIGSLSTLLLFVIHHNGMLLLYKFIISIVMVIITFRYESFNYFKENLFWLYIISIILGGSIYLLNDQITLTNNGIAFSAEGFKINIIILTLIGPVIFIKYIKYQRKMTINNSKIYDVDIYYKDLIISETAFLDTGNKLVDPYFGRPIILVNKLLVNIPVKAFLVPYKVINDSGLLEVFKPDKVLINKQLKKKVLIGLTDVNINGNKIVLNEEAL